MSVQLRVYLSMEADREFKALSVIQAKKDLKLRKAAMAAEKRAQFEASLTRSLEAPWVPAAEPSSMIPKRANHAKVAAATATAADAATAAAASPIAEPAFAAPDPFAPHSSDPVADPEAPAAARAPIAAPNPGADPASVSNPMASVSNPMASLSNNGDNGGGGGGGAPAGFKSSVNPLAAAVADATDDAAPGSTASIHVVDDAAHVPDGFTASVNPLAIEDSVGPGPVTETFWVPPLRPLGLTLPSVASESKSVSESGVDSEAMSESGPGPVTEGLFSNSHYDDRMRAAFQVWPGKCCSPRHRNASNLVS